MGNWSFFYKEIGIPIFEFYGFEGFSAFKEQVSFGKGFWAWVVLLVIAGFTPVPFKLLTISSGFINFNFWFYYSCFNNKGFKIFLTSWIN